MFPRASRTRRRQNKIITVVQGGEKVYSPKVLPDGPRTWHCRVLDINFRCPSLVHGSYFSMHFLSLKTIKYRRMVYVCKISLDLLPVVLAVIINTRPWKSLCPNLSSVASFLLAISLISAFRPPSTRRFVLCHRSHALGKSRRRQPGDEILEDIRPEGDEHAIIPPSKHTLKPLWALKGSVGRGGVLSPVRLLRQDLLCLARRYVSNWTIFNQLIFASAV